MNVKTIVTTVATALSQCAGAASAQPQTTTIYIAGQPVPVLKGGLYDRYNLPKWLTDIHYKETDNSVVVEIYDAKTKQLDVMMETRKPL